MTNEPTTGEIVRAIRDCYGTDCLKCVCHRPGLEMPLCGAKHLADRLESQERELSGITGELERFRTFHERYAEQTSKKYTDDICALTARAESAERERDAAVNNAVRAVFYDTSNGKRGLLVDAGLCDYCQSDRERMKCASCFENGNFELRKDLRGPQPQEGEGK